MQSPNTVIAAIIGLCAIAGLGFAAWYSSAPVVHELHMTSGSPGGTYNTFAHILAETVNETSHTLHLNVSESAGANENVARLSASASDIGLIQSDTVITRSISIAARLFPEVFHLIASNRSGIKNVSDLRGKRVALLPEGAGSNDLFARLLSHYEIGEKEITITHGTLADGGEALHNGTVDALFIVIALGNPKVEAIIQSADVQLIPIDQADALALFDPALRAGIIPIGTYSGDKPVPSESIAIVAVDSMLAVHRDLPKEAVEELTRILFEQRQNMLRRIPQAAFISEPTAIHKLAFDIHPGAESFYNKDKPPFIVEYAEPMAFGMSALVLILSGIWQGRIWLSERRKDRADYYNLELLEIINRVEQASSVDELDAIRTNLFSIFEKVLMDLDTDKIEEKSLQSFSFAWDVAASTLNHRQIVLSNQEAQTAS